MTATRPYQTAAAFGYIDAVAFGVPNDGTDGTLAMASLITQYATGDGKVLEIYFRSGRYVFDNATFGSPTTGVRVRLVGENPANTYFEPATATTPILTVQGAQNTQSNWLRFEGISLRLTADRQYKYPLVVLKKLRGWTIEDVFLDTKAHTGTFFQLVSSWCGSARNIIMPSANELGETNKWGVPFDVRQAGGLQEDTTLFQSCSFVTNGVILRGADGDRHGTEFDQVKLFQAASADFAKFGESLLTSATSIGATSIAVTAATGNTQFEVGAPILVGKANNAEVAKVATVAANAITVTQPLEFAHSSGDPVTAWGFLTYAGTNCRGLRWTQCHVEGNMPGLVLDGVTGVSCDANYMGGREWIRAIGDVSDVSVGLTTMNGTNGRNVVYYHPSWNTSSGSGRLFLRGPFPDTTTITAYLDDPAGYWASKGQVVWDQIGGVPREYRNADTSRGTANALRLSVQGTDTLKIQYDGTLVNAKVATQSPGDNSTKPASTAYTDTADALKANLASPTFTGTPSLPTGTTGTTQAAADGSTKLATTAYVDTAGALKANLASPTFTGTPAAPTAAAATSTTQIATTAMVQAAIAASAPAVGVFAGSIPVTDKVNGFGLSYPTFPRSNGSDTAATWRVRHTVLKTCSGIRIVYTNFNWDTPSGSEAQIHNITVRAGIEYGGNFYAVFFDGARSKVIEPGGWAVSDPVGVNIVAGQYVYSRSYVSVTSGQKWPFGALTTVVANGEGNTRSSGPAGTDMTISGTVPTANEVAYSPFAILGAAVPGTKWCALIGDSIGAGETNSSSAYSTEPSANTGGMALALAAANIGYINTSRTGDRADDAWSTKSIPLRRGVIWGATHAILALGRNDLTNSVSAATLETTILAIAADLKTAGMKVYLSTITPLSSSTDSFATTGNQTTGAGNAQRLLYNTWVRTTPTGVDGYIEAADAVESARDSGKWKAPSYTSDGLHPTITGHQAIQAAAATVIGGW